MQNDISACDSHAIRDQESREFSVADLDRENGVYTMVQVASSLGVNESTVRGWFAKVSQVCPSNWLKVSGRHTQLSAALLADYGDRVSSQGMASEAWIVEVKAQLLTLEQGTANAVAANCELATQPNQITGGAMASYLDFLDTETQGAMANVESMMDALDAAELEDFKAEIQARQKRGAQKAAILYAAEKQAQNQAQQALRQKEIERRRASES